MTGINKRSNIPNSGQKKSEFNDLNPAYGSFAIIKKVGDAFARATGQAPVKGKKK